MTDPGKTINLIKQGLVSFDDILYPGKYLEDVNTSDLKIDVLPSGFSSLDEYSLLKKGRSELIIIGGRPSHGKSALMFQLAFQVATHTPVHVFSLEMDHQQILTRIVSSMINIPITAIQRGHHVEKVEAAKREIKLTRKYIVDDRAGINVHELADAARQRHKKDGTGLIVIDYLQLLRTEKGHSKDDEIGRITRELKALAKDLRVPVVVGSQLNRNNELRGGSGGNYRPQLSDLRESGNIEQDADIVALVHRESRYTGLRQEEADVFIVKNRQGTTGEVVMKWIPTQTKFEDLEQI
jgi:replicative DNA helicase